MTGGPVVVKVGGSIAARAGPVLDDISEADGVVLVHGFGPQTDEVCRERGIEPRTIRSPSGVASRFTDEPVLEAMREAAERVRGGLVEGLVERGVEAVGLGGDERLVRAQAKPALRHEREDGRVVLVRGNRSGRVRSVDVAPVREALEAGRVPVVSPLAEDEGGPVSVDADRAAAAWAGGLGASVLVLLTDVPGVLEDPLEASSRIERVRAGEVEALVGEEVTGGMVRKVVAAREAVEAGCSRVVVASGVREAPVGAALEGEGTEVVA